MYAVSVSSRIKDRRPLYRAVCTCGFKSREHMSADSAVNIVYGHAAQCREGK